MRPIDHVGVEQLPISDIRILALKLAVRLDLLVLLRNPRVVRIAFAVGHSEDIEAVLPAVLAREPTWRLREEHHTEKEKDSWNHLESPWSTEGASAADERATVGDIEHDHNTPGNGPLLGADETATLRGGRNFGDVDRDLSRLNTDRETVDNAADDQHWNVLRRGHDDATNDPGYLRQFTCFETQCYI